MKLIVAITGASGVIYGKRLLEVLKSNHEVHLIMSNTSEKLIELSWEQREKNSKS